MSKEVTLEQILEVTDQIRSGRRTGEGRITGWAVQALIEDAPKIAFDWLLKKIIEEAREASIGWLCVDNQERAMTVIAIASITRKPNDIKAARGLITGLNLFLDPAFEARFLVELASITHKPEDIKLVRQAIKEKKLTGYPLVKAYALLYEVTGEYKFIDLAHEKAKEINEIEALMILNSCADENTLFLVHKEIFHILDQVNKTTNMAKITRAEIATLGATRKSPVRARALAEDYSNAKHILENFAAIAAFTRDPDDLERAYLAANEAEKKDPDRGAKSWRLIARILAGVD